MMYLLAPGCGYYSVHFYICCSSTLCS